MLLFSSTINQGYSQKESTGKDKDIGALFIEAINSIPTENQNGIISQIFSETLLAEKGHESLIKLLKSLNASYAPLEYHHTDINQFKKPSGQVYVMHIYARKKGEVMWQDFQLYVDSPPNHKINKLAFIAEVAEPINLPNGTLEQSETIEWLNNYIAKLHAENDLSGSILIAKGNGIILERYFGYSNLEKTLQINEKSLFGMASGGKMFTALCIAKLVENNFIKYDDKITKYIEGFKDKAKADQITIHHLLSHTSGIAQYWWGQESESFQNANSIGDHLKMVLEAGFQEEAGKSYEYNNSNYILLGAIIEKVSGTDYYSYVQEQVFNPAKMDRTGYFLSNCENTVTPLTRNDQGNNWVKVESGRGRGSSAGGAYSNAKDLLFFSMALQNNLIVSSETLHNMIEIKNEGFDATEEYGYGFIIQNSNNEKSFGHGGTAKGVNFEFRYFADQGITFILFSNQDNGAFDDLKRNTIKLITGIR